ncbi:helix-hairpin-helix domain-containing protein [Haladaptatus salinisoli]|uniref:helix-hairpin-helix domain-containing protein n=1 Tax=Haladaptatus salinisoli TaxID=2884876 RepID=UPI001D09D470|nr:helix-hairpin-helix domain-containing protein [Haladaptatus salinisoli]
MGLITRLKSLLGLGEERSQTRRSDSGVTIEREPTEASEQPDATNEKAVKQTDESPAEDASVSTEDVVDEGEPTDHIEEAEPDTAAEPSEATGPEPEAGQPAQTEATEPEPGPEEVDEDSDEAVEGEDETEAATEEDEALEEETESEETAEAGRPLEDVKGIGPAYAERLRNAGVEDSAALATADAEELAEATDLSPKRVEGWIERAKSM